MKYIYFPSISSTQKVLLDDLKKELFFNVCYWSDYQTDGIGSKENKWLGKKGNLFFSFVVKNNFDVPLQSFSIYFGFIIKKTLNNLGSKVVLKWPNDLYLEKKVGGVITNIYKNLLICGIGINTKFCIDEFDRLDIEVKNVTILEKFFKNLFKKPSFKEIIKDYKKEFILTKKRFKIEGELAEDGSLIYKNKRIYSKR